MIALVHTPGPCFLVPFRLSNRAALAVHQGKQIPIFGQGADADEVPALLQPQAVEPGERNLGLVPFGLPGLLDLAGTGYRPAFLGEDLYLELGKAPELRRVGRDPDELFGPISVAGLKEDKYRRVTTGKMPEAHLVFLDEVFKASSAILNTLLRILNERLFENGDGTLVKVPLLLCVSASNEWPNAQEGGKELHAVFDRYLFRRTVRPILTAAGRQRLLWTRDHSPRLSTTISPEKIAQARADALALPWADEAREALELILRELAKEGIQPGDRRQFKSVGAAQAFAYLSGSDRVEPEHLEILASTLWDDPQEQPEKVAGIVARIANPTGMKVNSLLLEVEQILAGTDVKQLAQAASAAGKLSIKTT